MIPSNKVYLPPKEEYEAYLDEIWDSGWVTNNGELIQTLERRLAKAFDVEYVRIVANGTLALQLALRVMNLQGDVVTTPFSYVATTSALIWETNCTPVFADVSPDTFNLSPERVEEAITEETCALLPTHVFGVPCDVNALRDIAEAHDLAVIYDAAHACGATLQGRSLLAYGNLSAVSFHATKLLHTVEGGALITDDPATAEKVDLLRAFGHEGPRYRISGINAKNSEFHAAMGLCLLPRLSAFIKQRRTMYRLYRSELEGLPLSFQHIRDDCGYNYAYFPVLFESHQAMLDVKSGLAEKEIYARRYFSPSLNKLPYIEAKSCPTAEDISSRILCLPFFQEITEDEVLRVTSSIRTILT